MLNVSLPTGDTYGWGVCGASLSKALAAQTNISILPQPVAGIFRPIATEGPLLQAVQGATFLPYDLHAWSKTRNIGLAFIEDRAVAQNHILNAERYFDHIIAGSTWCANMIRDIGFPSVSVAIQGVDTELFKPPAGRPQRETFNIFSGGKFEYRKGQDLVIAAYKHMMQKYPDVHLIASWGNQWITTMDSMRRSRYIRYGADLGGTWEQKVRDTMALNGIPEDRYTLIPLLPHSQMPSVYIRADVGVFPNRCEAGTNLVLCEMMACGVPVIASRWTGHGDVVIAENSFPIGEGRTTEDGWFEPLLDELIATIETVYNDRETAYRLGMEGPKFMRRLTWSSTAEAVIRECQIPTN